MKIIKESNKALGKAIEILLSGGLVVFPCETVYGVAVDCQNLKAVKKLNTYKKRPFGKPYAIMVSDQKMAEKYVKLNTQAKKLYSNFLPGPLTIISTGKQRVAPGIESESGSLGVRIPNYPFMLDLIKKFDRPIVATSANASYQRRPYKLSHILDNISQKQKGLIDLMIDAGTLPTREPSTVIDTTLDDPAILRQGEIKLKDKNEVLSRSEENTMNLAKELWQKYESFKEKRAIVFALEGKMGAGKTIFVKGLAKAMGIKQQVTSPTYDLLSTYNIQHTTYNLAHIDTWRMIEPAEELKNLGTEELINDKSVIAIEWADKIEKYLRIKAEDAVIVWVRIVPGVDINERLISWGAL